MAPARTAALLLVQLAAADAFKDWCIQGPAPAQPNSRYAEPEDSPCAREEAALARMPDVLARINKAASRKGIAEEEDICKEHAANFFKACGSHFDDATSRRGIAAAAKKFRVGRICDMWDAKSKSCKQIYPDPDDRPKWLNNMCWDYDNTKCKCGHYRSWQKCTGTSDSVDDWNDDMLHVTVFGNCKAACLLGWCKSGCLHCTTTGSSRDAAIAGRDAVPSSTCSREEEVLAGMPEVLARLNEAASRNGIAASKYGAAAVFNGHEATTAASNYGAATAALVSVPLLVGFVAGVLVISVYHRKKAGGVHEPRSAAPDEEEARMTAADAEPALQQISL